MSEQAENKNTIVETSGSTNIHPRAQIGDGTRIWHFNNILRSARIGENCMIGSYCEIAGVVGDRCRIQNNALIYNGVIIEDDVFIGPRFTSINILRPRAFIKRYAKEYIRTRIKKCATIGASVTILAGVTVGEYAIVGAGSMVVTDVIPYSVVVGNPAVTIGWACKNGHKLRNKIAECEICKEMEAVRA